jgi:hypothetical protein
MSSQIHRASRSSSLRPTSSMGGPTPWDVLCAALSTSEAYVTVGRATFRSMGGPLLQDVQTHGMHPHLALRPDGSPSPTATPDDDVDPPLLPRPTTSATPSGDPSPRAQVPPVSGVVTDYLECYCGATVWLQDRLSGVEINCL